MSSLAKIDLPDIDALVRRGLVKRASPEEESMADEMRRKRRICMRRLRAYQRGQGLRGYPAFKRSSKLRPKKLTLRNRALRSSK